jgi:GlpG protein
MRQIGSLEDRDLAQRFEDYLLARGIRSRLDETTNGHEIWVIDEDQVDQARSEFEEYLTDPELPRYREAAEAAGAIRRKNEQAIKEAKRRFMDMRQRWEQPFVRRSPVTFALIATSAFVVVFTSDGFWQLCNRFDTFLTYLYVTPVTADGRALADGRDALQATIMSGQLWRLVTPIFIHMNPLHILFNMMWLRDLGSVIEFRKGSWKLLAMVLLIAAVSNAAQCLAHGPAFGGMSGVVFGLFGYIWIRGRIAPEDGFFIHPNTVFLMMLFFVMCVAGFFGNIANWAHGIGLLVGVLLAYAAGRR